MGNRCALWGRWVLANAVGELIGLGLTFALGAEILAGPVEALGSAAVLVSAALMTATGALEGVVVGLAQWAVLRRAVAGVGRRAWVLATMIGAVVAWLSASIPMALASVASESAAQTVEEPPQALMLLLAGGMGLLAGLVLSAAQWGVLRRHVARAWLWLPANALAWAAGMPLIFAGVDIAQQVGSVAGAVAVMAGIIALAGALVGAIHGVAVVIFSRAGEEDETADPKQEQRR